MILVKSTSTVITSSSADSQVTVVVKYGNTTAAVSKSDGLAVLGFFFEVSEKSNGLLVLVSRNL